MDKFGLNSMVRGLGLFCFLFFNGLWIVFDVDIDPHHTRNAEDIDEINDEEYAQ